MKKRRGDLVFLEIWRKGKYMRYLRDSFDVSLVIHEFFVVTLYKNLVFMVCKPNAVSEILVYTLSNKKHIFTVT